LWFYYFRCASFLFLAIVILRNQSRAPTIRRVLGTQFSISSVHLRADFFFSEMIRDDLIQSYLPKQAAIRTRLAEFALLQEQADDQRLFEELAYCIFTAGASARMGLNSIERVRPVLLQGTCEQLSRALAGVHRYPNARAQYIFATRNYLETEWNFSLRAKLGSFGNDYEARRDFFALNKNIKGIGFKEASHYLRNIGYRGYAILDKHILRTLAEVGLIASPEPPSTKKKYLAIEEIMRKFAERLTIDFDELDLLLWSNKTGEILK
jgi:N-glycosylase/DNA lyase